MLSEKRLAEILRVNHSGEYGAIHIYKGQLSQLKSDANIAHMYEQEKEHLEFFEKELVERNVRPSLLLPFWRAGGFIMGKLTAKLGSQTAMLCTEAVEEVITDHYNSQLKELELYEPELAEKIKQFRDDEKEHHDKAIELGSKQAPVYPVLSSVIKAVSKVAIKIAEKI